MAAATLTPVLESTVFEIPAAGVGVCDFSRIGPAPLDALRSINEISLNILLFVPFGVAVGLLPIGRPKAVVVLAAIALPFAIEGIQLVATALHRGCQSADVADNLTGLIAGLIIGEAVRLVPAARHAGVNSNVLTDEAAVDPVSGNAVLNGIPVTVRPLAVG